MSNNAPAGVRKPAVRNATDRDSADVDPRVARTTRALGRALIALIEERDFNGITVQHLLDRAGVGRTAFYTHYRNKHDVLHSSYEGVFTWLDAVVERPTSAGPVGGRLFPVAEFLVHVGEVQAFVHALQRDGLLDDVWALFAGHAARSIERRIDRWAGIAAGRPTGIPLPLLARMLAGALVESVRWWQIHPSAATPAAVDTAFHEFARGVLQRQRTSA